MSVESCARQPTKASTQRHATVTLRLRQLTKTETSCVCSSDAKNAHNTLNENGFCYFASISFRSFPVLYHHD